MENLGINWYMIVAIGAAVSVILAVFTVLLVREQRHRMIEANACAYAAACVQAERAEFGSYNDRDITPEENFEFYKQFYIESELEMEGAS